MSYTTRSFRSAGGLALALALLVGAEVAQAQDSSQTNPAAAATSVGTQPPGDTMGKAPFGLTWGATKAEIEKLGVTLTPTPDQSSGGRYVATNLPMVIADVETVVLDLGFGGKLYRISAISRTYENDPYGTSVRARYEELVSLLKQKYGPGRETEQTDENYGGDDWAYGLMKNKNWLFSIFESGPISIEISCRSLRMSDPYWVMIYEESAGAARETEAKAEHEKGAL